MPVGSELSQGLGRALDLSARDLRSGLVCAWLCGTGDSCRCAQSEKLELLRESERTGLEDTSMMTGNHGLIG